jgi:hypothetical protein
LYAELEAKTTLIRELERQQKDNHFLIETMSRQDIGMKVDEDPHHGCT